MIIPNAAHLPDLPGWTPLAEFNPNHEPAGSPKGGQFARGQGGGSRPVPIKVSSISEAVSLILKGKVVELSSTRAVNTVLTKLAAIAKDAKARGEDAPKYDLCNVSVAGTNIFCGSKLRSREFPNGVPRIKMPQTGGYPTPGTLSNRLDKDKNGKVDGAPYLVAHLKSLGIKTTSEQVSAASLKASQAQLDGSKVAGMMVSKRSLGATPIFISRDNYVVDGHHRWAALVGRDAEDGRLGGNKMRVVRIDAPISEVLKISRKWAKKFGIKGKPAA